MMKYVILFVLILFSLNTIIFSQEIDRHHGKFIESKSEFREEMTKSAKEFKRSIRPEAKF